MSSNTKIVVLRSKELVYALVLLIVSVLIIMVAISLFMPSDKASGDSAPPQNAEEGTSEVPSEVSTDSTGAVGTAGTETDAAAIPDDGTAAVTDLYVPGIYSSTLQLGSSNVELQITVDKNHINSINLTNLDESVTTLYPLMHPTLTELAAVILSEQSLENVSYNDENRYTSMLLMQVITSTLDKAVVSENADRPETGIIY